MSLAKTKLSRISGFFPKAMTPHLISSHGSLTLSGSEKRRFPIILPQEDVAGGWKLTVHSTAQGRPEEVGRPYLCSRAQELPWGRALCRMRARLCLFGRLCWAQRPCLL